MDNPQSILYHLPSDKVAVLDDEHKAIFAALDEKDQDFFAENFSPQDLPGALDRKWEIIQRNRVNRERFEKIMAQMAESASVASGSQPAGDIVTAAAAALGVGAGVAMAATDNTAFYRGANPADFIEPLRTEFETERTTLSHSGSPDALTVAVSLITDNGSVPAMTINLTRLNDGTDVKVNELNKQGILETLKEGGKKLIHIAGQGLTLLGRKQTGSMRPGDLITAAGQTIESGADLAQEIGNLKLKERAWQMIKQTAETIEASYLDRLEKERQARAALETAWDNFYNCPTCGVSFQNEETVCRVCGSARPEMPRKPDPRKL